MCFNILQSILNVPSVMSIQKIAECKQFPTFLRFNLTALTTTTQRGRKAQEMSHEAPLRLASLCSPSAVSCAGFLARPAFGSACCSSGSAWFSCRHDQVLLENVTKQEVMWERMGGWSREGRRRGKRKNRRIETEQNN